MRCFLLALILFAHAASATTYYVDFDAGDDAADGLSARSAWKHAPGDRNARATPAAARLGPGDVVRFKGGVHYRGELVLEVSGEPGRPIVLDGNTDGGFGVGRAVMDGAHTIRGWQAVGSAEEVGGNPLWRQMRYADVAVDLSANFGQDRFVLHRDGKPDQQAPWQRLFLVDGDRRVLPIAQRPKPADAFYPDLPEDFYVAPGTLANTYPHELFYEPGSKGNRTLPLIAITYGGPAPVIEPFNGGAFSVRMSDPQPIAAIGITLFRPRSVPVPERVVFYIDGREACVAEIDPTEAGMQRFALPEPVTGRMLTFELRHGGEDLPGWTKLQQVAAFTPDGQNVVRHAIDSTLEDPQRLTRPDAGWYDGVFVGVHGGNNHVYFAPIRRYEPASARLVLPHFAARTYAQTRWALYNAPQLIDRPGEWCLVPMQGGKTRVYLLPEPADDGTPGDVGYPALRTAVTLQGSASHLEVRGFLMQRYAGGQGGVALNAKGPNRPSHIRIADCEVRYVSGQSGISINHSDHVTVQDCYIHHCPGWTVGVYLNRATDFRVIGNRLDTNSGSGIRHYEAKRGVLRGNAVLNHFGMHSSGVNFYEGCAQVLFEDNTVHNVIAINRNADRLVFRNNVVDSRFRNALSVAIWQSGRTGGRDVTDLTFENNTLVHLSDADWATSIFVQGNAPAPRGLVVRNNILDRLRTALPGTVEGNLLLTPDGSAPGGWAPATAAELFRDAPAGDLRRKPGGPRPDAGADLPQPGDRR